MIRGEPTPKGLIALAHGAGQARDARTKRFVSMGGGGPKGPKDSSPSNVHADLRKTGLKPSKELKGGATMGRGVVINTPGFKVRRSEIHHKGAVSVTTHAPRGSPKEYTDIGQRTNAMILKSKGHIVKRDRAGNLQVGTKAKSLNYKKRSSVPKGPDAWNPDRGRHSDGLDIPKTGKYRPGSATKALNKKAKLKKAK